MGFIAPISNHTLQRALQSPLPKNAKISYPRVSSTPAPPGRLRPNVQCPSWAICFGLLGIPSVLQPASFPNASPGSRARGRYPLRLAHCRTDSSPLLASALPLAAFSSALFVAANLVLLQSFLARSGARSIERPPAGSLPTRTAHGAAQHAQDTG